MPNNLAPKNKTKEIKLKLKEESHKMQNLEASFT
jgi:hypothetical protein